MAIVVERLDWDGAVRDRIRQFNEHPQHPWEDYLIHEVRGQDVDAARLPALAFVVACAWNAGVDARARIPVLGPLCQHIARKASDLLALRDKLRPLRLQDSDLTQVNEVGTFMLKVVLPESMSTHGVFPMKFIHWCEPRVLPPLDKQAWTAINRLTGDDQRWPGDMGWTLETCAESWHRALCFYDKALSHGRASAGQVSLARRRAPSAGLTLPSRKRVRFPDAFPDLFEPHSWGEPPRRGLLGRAGSRRGTRINEEGPPRLGASPRRWASAQGSSGLLIR
jgi:hypothetical protein